MMMMMMTHSNTIDPSGQMQCERSSQTQNINSVHILSSIVITDCIAYVWSIRSTLIVRQFALHNGIDICVCVCVCVCVCGEYKSLLD